MLPSSALICASWTTSSSGAAKTGPDGLNSFERWSTSQTTGASIAMASRHGRATARAMGRLWTTPTTFGTISDSEQDSDREEGREPDHRSAAEQGGRLSPGDGRARRVGRGVHDEDRGDGALHVVLEPLEHRTRPTASRAVSVRMNGRRTA